MSRSFLLALPIIMLVAIPLVADEGDEQHRTIKNERTQVIQRNREHDGGDAEHRERMEAFKDRLSEMKKAGVSEEELVEFRNRIREYVEQEARARGAEHRERDEREHREREERERRERRHHEHADHGDHDHADHEHEHHEEHGHHEHDHDGHEHHGEYGPEHGDEFGQRMHHLQVAADNLLAAGMRDMAEEVMHRAEALEREHHDRDGGHRPYPEMMGEIQEQMHHLQRQMEELHHHVRNLERVIRDHHDDDADDDDDDD